MKSQIDIFDEIIVDNFAGGGGGGMPGCRSPERWLEQDHPEGLQPKRRKTDGGSLV